MNNYLCFVRMLLTGRTAQGAVGLSPKMHGMLQLDLVTPAQMPLSIGAVPIPGFGRGLTGRVMTDPSAAIVPKSSGEFGQAGAVDTYFWVNQREDMVDVLMT